MENNISILILHYTIAPCFTQCRLQYSIYHLCSVVKHQLTSLSMMITMVLASTRYLHLCVILAQSVSSVSKPLLVTYIFIDRDPSTPSLQVITPFLWCLQNWATSSHRQSIVPHLSRRSVDHGDRVFIFSLLINIEVEGRSHSFNSSHRKRVYFYGRIACQAL